MTESKLSKRNRLFIGSVAKSFDVLRAFVGAGRYLSLAEVVVRSGLDKSTAQRMTHTLEELGYLRKCPDTRRYSLGQPLLDFSFQYIRTEPLVELATPQLIELRRACEERVDLSLFDEATLVYVVRLQSKRENFYTTLVGRRMPVFCTAGGRAMLACLPDAHAREIVETNLRIPRSARTITDVPSIIALIETARQDGYAVAVEESISGEIVVAAALVGSNGQPLGAVHIAGSTREWKTENFVATMTPKLLETTGLINRSLLEK